MPLNGKPVVQWVLEGAHNSGVFDRVLVATDSTEIRAFVDSVGGDVVMTRSDHESGTDRVAEVAEDEVADVFVNVQGDQPFVSREMLEPLVAPFAVDDALRMSTLGAPLDPEQHDDPNTVKVVCDRNGDALYFSRSAIPYYRNDYEAPVFHHVGLYAFRREFLLTYANLAPTPLERCEGLEQLRVLEHGYRIRVCRTASSAVEINTPEDLAAAEAAIRR